MGAVPNKPPNSTVLPTVLPMAGIILTAVVLLFTMPIATVKNGRTIIVCETPIRDSADRSIAMGMYTYCIVDEDFKDKLQGVKRWIRLLNYLPKARWCTYNCNNRPFEK